MTYPINPPPELVQQWCAARFFGCPDKLEIAAYELVRFGAEYGADQELEACCKWLEQQAAFHPTSVLIRDLRAARRPKPPSLAEEALELVALIQGNKKIWQIEDLDVVRCALLRLQKLEGGNG